MKITNAKKFQRTVKALADFCKPIDDKKRFCDNRIFAMDGKFYATNNRLMIIADVSDCVESIEESGKPEYAFSFPTSVKAAAEIKFKDDSTLIVDGKELEVEQHYINLKQVIPTKEPSAELFLDFSEHGWDIGKFGKSANVTFSKEEVVFDYADETECKYTTDQCFVLLKENSSGFEEVSFPMSQVKAILKLSKKNQIKIEQFGAIEPRRIIAGDYEIIINPIQ